MPQINSKLEFFLQLALQDQQFPLIILDTADQKAQIETAFKKHENLDAQDSSTDQVIAEIKEKRPDLFEEGAPDQFSLKMINLGNENIEEVLEIVSQIKNTGTFNQLQTPDYMKFLFYIEKAKLPKAETENRIRFTLSPIFEL